MTSPRDVGGRALAAWLLFAAAGAAAEIPVGGLVVTDGKPLAGATVRLIPVAGALELGRLRLRGAAEPDAVAQVRSDERGAFRLTAPGAGIWKLRVSAAGHLDGEIYLEPLLDAVELPPVQLPRDEGLKTRLTEDGDVPLAARVCVACKRGETWWDPHYRSSWRWGPAVLLAATDAEGEVYLAASGGSFGGPVQVFAAGRPPLDLDLGLPPQAVARLHAAGDTLTLKLDYLMTPAGAPRQLEVRDSAGRPLEGAVLFEAGGFLPLAATGAGGRVALAVGAQGLDLVVLGPGGESLRHALQPSDDPEAVERIRLEPPRRARGRVLDATTREPVAGAVVWVPTPRKLLDAKLFGPPRFEMGAWLPAPYAAVPAFTDPRGRYAVETAPGADLFVAAAASGYRTGGAWLGAAPADGAPTLLLEPAAALRGTVVDEESRPVAAEIEIPGREPGPGRDPVPRLPDGWRDRSSPDGRFLVSGLTPGRSFELRVASPGLAPRKISVEALQPFETRLLEVVMGAGRRAFGRVVGPAEEPVAGAWVWLSGVDGGLSSDAEGRFEVPRLAAGTYDITVQAEGFATASVPGIEVAGGRGEVDLGTVVLAPGATLAGRVVDGEGRGLGAAEIRLTRTLWRIEAEPPEIEPRLVTGDDGRFTVPDLQPGERYHLRADLEGYAAAVLTGLQVPAEAPVEVVLEPEARVSGRVVDGDGHGLEGVQVKVEGSLTTRLATTDAQGGFEVRDAEPGQVAVSAELDGYRRARREGLEAPAGGELRGVEIVLERGAMLRGTVSYADGTAVAGATIELLTPGVPATDDGWKDDEVHRADGDGRFEIPGVGLGKQQVRVLDASWRHVIRTLEVEPGVNIVDLVFDETGVEVSGHAVDETGQPLAGATVSLRATGRARGWRSVDSGADGGFAIAAVEPGSYRLSGYREGYVAAEQPVEVGSEPVAGLEIRFGAGTTLRGRVLGLELDRLAQVEVQAGGQRTGVAYDGRFEIRHLAAGEEQVTARLRDSGRAVQETVRIPEGTPEVTVELDFDTPTYVLTGVALHGDEPIAAARVALFTYGWPRAYDAEASTGGDGRFRFEGLAEGVYELELEHPRLGLEHRQSLRVAGDEDVVVRLGGGRIAGALRSATDFGPVAGAVVMLVEDGPMAEYEIAANPRRFRQVTSDSAGSFRFDGVAAGAWLVVARKSGFAPARAAVELAPDAARDGVELVLSPAGEVALRVVLGSGRVPAFVDVVSVSAAGQVLASGRYPTAGGEVRLATIPPGDSTLLLSAEDSAVVKRELTLSGDAGRLDLGRVELPAGGSLRIVPEGRLPELEGAKSIRFGVEGPEGSGLLPASMTVFDDGFGYTRLLPGTWTFSITADDGRVWSREVVVVAGETAEVRVQP